MRLRPNPGYAKLAARRRCIAIAAPALAAGSRGPAVRFLERRLDRLHYLLLNQNASFGADTRDAVYAFQKIERLARTGVVGPGDVERARPRPHPARLARRDAHRGPQAAPGAVRGPRRPRQARRQHLDGADRQHARRPLADLPQGRRQQLARDARRLYFIGGYAVHGYHSVPPYQASHGCARIPLWAAHGVYSRWDIGDTVYVL